MVNPYESPEPIKEAAASPSRGVLRAARIVFCLVNLAVAGWGVACGIVAFYSREGSLGAVFVMLFVPLFALYGLGEVLAIVRPSVERMLGNLNIVAATVVIVGIVGNSLEAFTRPPVGRSFLYVFLPIAGAIALYLTSCGWIRLRIEVDK